ncbi:MAG: acyltransferase [Deltaproteobacteria bacterium]|nr:acyltransferase [Deltaproteobacteria bacterium]
MEETGTKNAYGRALSAWKRGGARVVVSRLWPMFWMRFAGSGFFGRIATRVAAWRSAPYFGRAHLARLYPKGFIALSAVIHHDGLKRGKYVCINDRVVIYKDVEGGPVELGDMAFIHSDNIIQTGYGGSVKIGERTHILPRCQLSAYKGRITIGSGVLVASNCAFYPYNHGIAAGRPIREQPIESKGGITVGDGAWLGYGVTVLAGVRIGNGAVVGAGSVVTRDIPDGAVAAGVPARVLQMRK